jgi:hydroxyacyl-ACP dehydratase HTD2-like protein with hotdog domain
MNHCTTLAARSHTITARNDHQTEQFSCADLLRPAATPLRPATTSFRPAVIFLTARNVSQKSSAQSPLTAPLSAARNGPIPVRNQGGQSPFLARISWLFRDF